MADNSNSNTNEYRDYLQSFVGDTSEDHKYATFRLSCSDTESLKTATSSLASLEHNYEDVSSSVQENENYHHHMIEPITLESILGISEDEKSENKISQIKPRSIMDEFLNNEEKKLLQEKELEGKIKRKAMSLKTCKSPSVGKKKEVRFADALGLDLTSIRHVIDLDQPPNLNLNLNSNLRSYKPSSSFFSRRLCTCFIQPESTPDFLRKVQEKRVLLENCKVDDNLGVVIGTVRVMNVAYNKIVVIKYSFDNWNTQEDKEANYESSSNDGATDKFSFQLVVPSSFGVGNNLEFCISYHSNDQTFWDNNYGSNYRVEAYLTKGFQRF